MANGKGYVETTAEAAVGGYQGMKKVRGLMVDLTLQAPNRREGMTFEPKQQMQITLEDAAILEFFPNADEFELKDNKLNIWVPYALEGKTPHANSIYMKCFVTSAEEAGKKPSEFRGEYITLERQARLLFRDRDKDVDVFSVGENGLPSSGSWCFITDETADSDTVKEYITGLVIGNKPTVAKRNLLTDPRAKQFPLYKDALNNETLDQLLPVKLVDGKYERA